MRWHIHVGWQIAYFFLIIFLVPKQPDLYTFMIRHLDHVCTVTTCQFLKEMFRKAWVQNRESIWEMVSNCNSSIYVVNVVWFSRNCLFFPLSLKLKHNTTLVHQTLSFILCYSSVQMLWSVKSHSLPSFLPSTPSSPSCNNIPRCLLRPGMSLG